MSLTPLEKLMPDNNLIALLDQTYPGVNNLFDSPVREDGSQKWVDFATTFWHVDCVRAMSLPAFTERYRNGVNGAATTSARAGPLRSTRKHKT